jgi:hypothetical protein
MCGFSFGGHIHFHRACQTTILGRNEIGTDMTHEKNSKHTLAGIGAGATIGAIAAGPPGAIAGAVIGGIAGASKDQEDQRPR